MFNTNPILKQFGSVCEVWIKKECDDINPYFIHNKPPKIKLTEMAHSELDGMSQKLETWDGRKKLNT